MNATVSGAGACGDDRPGPGRQAINPIAGKDRLAGFFIRPKARPVALRFICFVRDGSFDDQDKGGQVSCNGAMKGLEEVFAVFDESVRDAEKCLKEMTDEKAQGNWRLMRQDRELMNVPRIAILRSIMLNHWYHHRGQLSVYLRLLDVPLPVIYGPSADENPFG